MRFGPGMRSLTAWGPALSCPPLRHRSGYPSIPASLVTLNSIWLPYLLRRHSEAEARDEMEQYLQACVWAGSGASEYHILSCAWLDRSVLALTALAWAVVQLARRRTLAWQTTLRSLAAYLPYLQDRRLDESLPKPDSWPGLVHEVDRWLRAWHEDHATLGLLYPAPELLGWPESGPP